MTNKDKFDFKKLHLSKCIRMLKLEKNVSSFYNLIVKACLPNKL